MNWKNLIENVDKSKENRNDVDLISLGEREFGKFDIPWLNAEDTPLKSYWYAKWLCTDTWVGGKIYFFNDEFVAVSWQSARKAYEEFHWASEEAYEKVAAYLESIRQADNIAHLGINFLDDIEDEVQEGFTIDYGSQALIKKGIVQQTGEKFEITKTWSHMDDASNWRMVEAKMENGETKTLNLAHVYFPYILK